MKRIVTKIAIGFGLLVLSAVLAGGLYVYNEFDKLASDDPLVWKSAIDELTATDDVRSVPDDAVLFVGSSSIRFWSTIREDMAPLPVIQRGFGGAKLSDVIYYADRIIWPYKTKSIVLFAGTNDITGRPNDKSPEELLGLFRELIDEMEERLPGTTLYYLPITPTSSRWDIWPKANRANKLIQEFARENEHVVYIDTTPHFLNEDGSLKEELLFWDGIHLNDQGYELWTTLVRQHLSVEADG